MRTIHREIAGVFIFSSDGYILLGKSTTGKGVYQGLFLVPGGGIDEGETPKEAAIREIREEVGLDISGYDLEPINDTQIGESEKTLQTGERVYVKMHFNDFLVHIPKPAAEIPFTASDDFEYAEWIAVTDIPNQKLGEAMKVTLQKLGYL